MQPIKIKTSFLPAIISASHSQLGDKQLHQIAKEVPKIRTAYLELA